MCTCKGHSSYLSRFSLPFISFTACSQAWRILMLTNSDADRSEDRPHFQLISVQSFSISLRANSKTTWLNNLIKRHEETSLEKKSVNEKTLILYFNIQSASPRERDQCSWLAIVSLPLCLSNYNSIQTVSVLAGLQRQQFALSASFNPLKIEGSQSDHAVLNDKWGFNVCNRTKF